MITPELESYIKNEVAKGTPIEVIKSNLQNGGGWSESEINQAFNLTLEVKNNNRIFLTATEKAFVALVVAINIILLVVIIYTTFNAEPSFNSDGALAKSFMGLGSFFLALPLSIITVIMGYIYWFRKKIPQVGIPLLLLGLFMFPPLGIKIVLNALVHDSMKVTKNVIKADENTYTSLSTGLNPKTQESASEQVGIVSENDQLFNAYTEAVNILKRKNVGEVTSYLKQYDTSGSSEIVFQRWQKYPEEFTQEVDGALLLVGAEYITKEKFTSGKLMSEKDLIRIDIKGKELAVTYMLFFQKINNNWYFIIPID